MSWSYGFFPPLAFFLYFLTTHTGSAAEQDIHHADRENKLHAEPNFHASPQLKVSSLALAAHAGRLTLVPIVAASARLSTLRPAVTF